MKYFQGLASSFADVLFWLITKMGEETFFLIVLALIYISYNKFFAVKYTLYYLISVGINSLVKIIIQRPRPHVVSGEIANRLPASGFSFPSGHSQGFFVQANVSLKEIDKKTKKRGIKIALLVTTILMGIGVMISRLYWGQHYLSDVVIGMMFGISIPFVIDFVLSCIPQPFKDKFTYDRMILIVGIIALAVASVAFILEMSSGFYSRKVYKFSAVLIALALGYFVDEKYIKYNPNQGFWWGVLKCAITTIVMVGLYLSFTLIIKLTAGYLYFFVYFLIGLVVSIVLPFVFRYFGRGQEV